MTRSTTHLRRKSSLLQKRKPFQRAVGHLAHIIVSLDRTTTKSLEITAPGYFPFNPETVEEVQPGEAPPTEADTEHTDSQPEPTEETTTTGQSSMFVANDAGRL